MKFLVIFMEAVPGGGRREAVELRGRRPRRRGQGQGEGVRRGRLQGRPAPVPAAARRGEAAFCYRLGSQGFGASVQVV